MSWAGHRSSPADLMRHALGVQRYSSVGRWTKPSRNYFVAGDGDADAWCSLAAGGMATLVREGDDLTGGDPVFTVTEAGRAFALAGITFKRRWGYGEPANP